MKQENTATMLQNFGENLRSEREKMGFTREFLADFTGITASYIGSLERGERTPSLATFLNICDFFGEDASEMLKPQTTLRIRLDGPPLTKQGDIRSPMELRRDAVISMVNALNFEELDNTFNHLLKIKSPSYKTHKDKKVSQQMAIRLHTT
jgi:transcriptional regulator with XRE-family HTH domain